MPRSLAAGIVLVLVGLGAWALYLSTSGGSARHSYDRGGHPPAYVKLLTGHSYEIAIHGGVNREVRLGLDPTALGCTVARTGAAARSLQLSAENTQTKALNTIATFVSPVSGVQVQVQCNGIGAVYVDDAEGSSFDWSGLWLVVTSIALVVGLPLALSGLRGAAVPSAAVPAGAGAAGEDDQVE